MHVVSRGPLPTAPRLGQNMTELREESEKEHVDEVRSTPFIPFPESSPAKAPALEGAKSDRAVVLIGTDCYT